MENHDLIDDEDINTFNQNFQTYEIDEISNLYKMREINDNNNDQNKLFPKIKEKKYNHPLIMNYNYCLFCLEKRKTKYYKKNLEDLHYKIDINHLSSFFDIYQIKLKEFKNKKEKLAKRRIIHSFSPKKQEISLNNYKKINNNNHSHESDTELYVEKDEVFAYKKSHRNSPKKKYFSRDNVLKAKNSNKYNNVNIQINNLLINNNSGNNSQEENSIKDKEYSIVKKLSKSSNYISDNESNRSSESNESNENNENSIDIKNIGKSKTTKDPDYSFRSQHVQNKSVEMSNHNITYIENNQNNLITSEIHHGSFNPKIKLERRDSDSIFAFIKNIFMPKKLSKKKRSSLIFKEESHIPYMQNGETTSITCIDYIQKNEKCEICLEDIKNKYTLVCGDFFCRECLRQQILNGMKDYPSFENIVCPNCKEPISESTIVNLLTNEEYEKYNSIKMKIDYLYNKRLRPCPFPDCEAFGIMRNKDDKILICQNKHYFCGDCLEVIDEKNINNEHICINKYPETTNYLLNEKTIRKCPQCGSWVQREEGGCNYFRCTNNWCRYQFCWICGEKYDNSHYQNPLSMCFGLSRAKEGLNIASSKKCLRIRCIIIFLLLVLVLLPIFIGFFSFVEVFLYTGIFVFDGKEVRFADIRHRLLKKLFYTFLILFYFFMGMALLSFGYISIIVLILITPVIVIYKKCEKERPDF